MNASIGILSVLMSLNFGSLGIPIFNSELTEPQFFATFNRVINQTNQAAMPVTTTPIPNAPETDRRIPFSNPVPLEALDDQIEVYLVEIHNNQVTRAEHYLRDFITHTFQRTKILLFNEEMDLIRETVFMTGLGKEISPFTKMELYYEKGYITRQEYYRDIFLDSYTENTYNATYQLLSTSSYQTRLGDEEPSLIFSMNYDYNLSEEVDLQETMEYYGNQFNLLSSRVRQFESFELEQPILPELSTQQPLTHAEREEGVSPWRQLEPAYKDKLPLTIPIDAPTIVVNEINDTLYRMTQETIYNHRDELVFQVRISYTEDGLKRRMDYSADGESLLRYFEFEYNTLGEMIEFRYYAGTGELESKFVRNRHGVWALYGQDDLERILY